jgi:hypothetical protein
MVTLFILLLLILGGVFLYIKKRQEDESETETETEAGSGEVETSPEAGVSTVKDTSAADARRKRAAARRKKLLDAAKSQAAAQKRRIAILLARKKAEEKALRDRAELAKKNKQRDLDNWGTRMGGGSSATPRQGHYKGQYNAKEGWLGKINAKLDNKGGKMKMTMRQCHDLGRDLQQKKWPISAVGYRTSTHPEPKWKNTCFFYGNWDHDGEKTTVPTGGRLTGNADKAHAIACMDPDGILEKGCKTRSYISYKLDGVRARQREVARGKRAEQDRLNEMPYGVHRKSGFPRHGWVNDKLNQSYAKIKNQSAKQCRDHAVTINKEAPGFVRVWGHYRSNYPDKNKRNTCFFYTANKSFMTHNDPKPPHFHGRAAWNGDGRHVSGCVEGGKRLESGCKDPRKINQERATYRSKTVIPGNISRQTGYRAGGTNLDMKPQQLKAAGPEECRQRAIELSKSTKGAIKGWGFRKSNHPQNAWKNTCFYYTGKGPHGHRGGTNNHLTGCLKPGDNVDWGCTRIRPVNCRQRWTGWSRCSKPCEGGTKKREYKTITPARGLGRACKPQTGAYATKIEPCNAHACRPTARYVDIVRYGQGDNIINLMRAFVWSNGQNVAHRRHVRMRWGGHPSQRPRHLTDGNRNSLAHTRGGRNTNWIRIDLGREYPIDYVWLENRKDCCQDRLKGMYLKLIRGRRKPGARWVANEVMRSDRMTETGAGWKKLMWQPSIGGTLGPMDPPTSYFRKYRRRNASSDD